MQKVKSLILILVWSTQHPIAGQNTQHQELIKLLGSCGARIMKIFLKVSRKIFPREYAQNYLTTFHSEFHELGDRVISLDQIKMNK